MELEVEVEVGGRGIRPNPLHSAAEGILFFARISVNLQNKVFFVWWFFQNKSSLSKEIKNITDKIP